MQSFLATCVVAGTPLLFAIVGEIITERSGSLNLGVEGMMLLGAIAGFATAMGTHNPYLAVLGAGMAGAGGALIYAVLTVSLRANQTVTGLTLTIFGTGVASFVGQPMLGSTVPSDVSAFFAKSAIPLLSDLPFIGPIFFRQDAFVYFGYGIVIIAAIYLYKTKAGLNLIAVGENTAAADASGINVNLYKYINILAGGALCGLGGAYLAVVRIPIWQSDVVAGRGWIAVALVIFASWNPLKAALAAVLFGGLSILGLRLQAMGFSFSQYLVDMIPYLATIIIVIFSTRKNAKGNLGPANMSRPYFREDR
jgi:general nucleoside transport system permease protein